MSTPALVPVAPLARAKGRLASLLDADRREALALAMLQGVLEALREAGFEPLVLTSDLKVAAACDDRATVVEETPEVEGLNAQLERAIELIDGGELLIALADLPLAAAGPFAALAGQAPPPPSATLAVSRDGGTNAMLLRPPGRFPLAYGPDSGRRHAEAARAAGMEVRLVDDPWLSLDLDTPEALAALSELDDLPATPAVRLLRSWGLLPPPGSVGEGRQ